MARRPTNTFGWAPPAGNVAEPLAGRKAAGWEDDDKPPAQEFNWFWELVTSWAEWMAENACQRIGSYEEATGWFNIVSPGQPELEDGEAFVLDDYDDSVRPFSTLLTISPPVTSVVGVASDGRMLMIAANNGGADGIILQFALEGTAWDLSWKAYVGDLVHDVSSSGRHIAVARANGVAGVSQVYRAADGSESVPSLVGTAAPAVAVDCVGAGIVVVDSAGEYDFASDMVGGTLHAGNHGAPLADCCGFGDRAIVVGDEVGGVAARGFDFTAGTALWTYTRGGGLDLFACCTDGDFLFLAGDADGAGHEITINSLYDGQKQAGVALGAAPTSLAVDDRYLYAGVGVELVVLEKRTLHVVTAVTMAGAVTCIAADGRRVYVGHGGDVTVVRRGELPRTCVFVDPQDSASVDTLLTNNRRPFHGLILPGGQK